MMTSSNSEDHGRWNDEMDEVFDKCGSEGRDVVGRIEKYRDEFAKRRSFADLGNLKTIQLMFAQKNGVRVEI